MSMINLEKITKVFGKNEAEVTALSGLSLKIDKGEMVAIMGPSGSGKSTLLNIIGCLDKQTGGSYYLDGEIIDSYGPKEMARIRNEKFGFVIQDFALIDRYNVEKNILIPLTYSARRISAKKRADYVLDRLKITEKRKVSACNLSGGQRQRVAIARAIINEPEIILADEPTGALDKNTGMEVMEIFKEINEDNKTVIIVTHDINIANFCNRIIVIEDGKVVKDSEARDSLDPIRAY